MKFVRFGPLDEEKPGLIDQEGHIRDISAYIPDMTPLTLAQPEVFKRLRDLDPLSLPIVKDDTRLGSCLNDIGKILCIGFNSQLHADEVGVMRNSHAEPVVFLKPNSCLSGPNDPIYYTAKMKKLDWEAELAIIIGKKAKYVSIEEAKDYIFGYACFHDLSERFLQLETDDKQFTKGKCFDGAGRLGPYLVTKDEVPNAQNLAIKLWVNQQLRQDFNSANYLYSDTTILSYLSQYFTLFPGDVISMGSGPGSAKAWGGQYLKIGDQVKLTIEGLGTQHQTVEAEKN